MDIVVAIIEKDGKFLSTSRKNNYELFGLPGGKVEPRDKSLLAAIIRETREETGVIILEAELISNRTYKGEQTYAFKVTKWRGAPFTDIEAKKRGEGMVRWLSAEDLSFGFCGDYNKDLLTKLK